MKGAATKPDKTSIKTNFHDTSDKFLDSEFPANAQSLIKNWRAAEPRKTMYLKEIRVEGHIRDLPTTDKDLQQHIAE